MEDDQTSTYGLVRARLVQRGLRWLEGAQNPDGGWGSGRVSPTDFAASARVEWAYFVKSCGKQSKESVKRFVEMFKRNQNPDGGWSRSVGGASDVMVTSSSIRVLLAAGEGQKGRQVRLGVEWLRKAQSPAGGWIGSGGEEDSELGLTAVTVAALVEAGGERSCSLIARAVEYLLQEVRGAKITNDRSFSDIALGVGALVAVGFSRDSVVVCEPLKALLLGQGRDGGWLVKRGVSSQVSSTVLVLHGLLDTGLSVSSDAVRKGVGFLLSLKNLDGGWARKWGEPSVPYVTAGVLALLCRLH